MKNIRPNTHSNKFTSSCNENGFDFFDKTAFLCVCHVNKKILSRTIVTELLDQQSVEIAKCIFSKAVEDIMIQNGDIKEARFVKLTREWYEACDECGIHPNEHINKWINMHNFLMEQVNLAEFPPSTHVKGIPIITFEGLLQGTSTRMMLYHFAKLGTFNNRAISTLGIESFFIFN